ncbi:MAG: type II glyceraldehyde-3-phosphate dehydrogenase [Candidatus Aenigmarchaeota archaeon]|nr:type II glyceraldehyde-3-phosphate dehydrogenase [Candidatus Aenigmarchaeota archaeon]
MGKVRVAVNGFGTIGKRVADAVSLQGDMELIGVTISKPSFKLDIIKKAGYPLYSALPGGQELKKHGAKGDINDLVGKADIIIDCSPEGQGAENKKLYQAKGKKAIFQGGEEAGIADLSFNARANFDQAKGKQFVRVVSCNTTGLCRTLYAIDQAFGIDNCYAVLVRRAADTGDSKKGPINALVPETSIPSHHGPDVQTVLPALHIMTAAVKASTTLMHLHVVSVKLKKVASKEAAIKALEQAGRILMVTSSDGIKSTAELFEYARDLGRKRGDLYEVAVWKDSVNVRNGILYYMQAVHQEADVVPENIDAIRAMLGTMAKDDSISKTDQSLGIL